MKVRSSEYTMPAQHQDVWYRPMSDIPLTEPRWVKTLYHNMHDYGWIVADNGPSGTGSSNAGTGANNSTRLQSISDYSWTTIGKPSQWTLMLNEITAEAGGTFVTTYNDGATGANFSQIQMPTDAATAGRIHWLKFLAH